MIAPSPAQAAPAAKAAPAAASLNPTQLASVQAALFAGLDDGRMDARRYAQWLLAAGGVVINGFSLVALGLALPLIKSDYAATPGEIGLIGAALMMGAVLGSLAGGPLADRLGRKPAFLIDMAVMVAGALVCTLAPGPALLILGQAVLGVGIGIDFPASGAYVAELMPRAARSRMVVATIAMQAVGMVAAAVVGIALFAAHPAAGDWRWLMAASGVLAAAWLLLRLRLPESPRWLVTRGRVAEAVAALEAMGDAAAGPALGAEVRALMRGAPASAAPPQRRLRELFASGLRMRTLLVSLPWLFMDVATYGVGLFTPVILGSMHLDGSHLPLLAAERVDAQGSALVDAFLLAGCIASLWLVPRFGRIPMQVAGFAGMALGMLVLVLATSGEAPAGSHLWLVVGGFMLFNLAMNAGPNATTFTLAPTLFPTAIRGSAAGFASASAKIGATFGTFVVPMIAAHWGLIGVLAMMVAVSVAGLLATAALAHEVNEEGELVEDAAPREPGGH